MNNRNTIKRVNRAQVEWMEVYKTFEFKVLDYLFFRSWPKEEKGEVFKFHVRTVAKETNVGIGTVSKLFAQFRKLGFITKFGEGQNSYFVFNYKLCYSHSVNKYHLSNSKSETTNSIERNSVSTPNSVVHPVNTTVHSVNNTVHAANKSVHGVVPISNKEEVKEKEEVPKQVLKKNSDEYNKLIEDIQYAKNWNKVDMLESLINNNEQSLRANGDYNLEMILLNQFKINLVEIEKRKNSKFNRC
jgi:hypothetical protein